MMLKCLLEERIARSRLPFSVILQLLLSVACINFLSAPGHQLTILGLQICMFGIFDNLLPTLFPPWDQAFSHLVSKSWIPLGLFSQDSPVAGLNQLDLLS